MIESTLFKTKKILVISHVNPLTGKSGQSNRLNLLLLKWRETSNVTLLCSNTIGYEAKHFDLVCDKLITLNYKLNFAQFIFSKGYYLIGQKPSNFILNKLVFSMENLNKHINYKDYDEIIFEYMYAYDAAKYIKEQNIKVVCDTHNILWRSYEGFLLKKKWIPKIIKKKLLNLYKKNEESAWKNFNEIIAITNKELRYIEAHVPNNIRTVLELYRVNWNRSKNKKNKTNSFVFFGGLKMQQNRDAAIFFSRDIKAKLNKISKTKYKYLVVGSNPDIDFKNKIKSFGVEIIDTPEHPEDYISYSKLAVIPFKGDFGFRTRIPELVHMGVDVLTNSECFDINDVSPKEAKHIHLIQGWNPEEWAKKILEIVSDLDKKY